MWRSGSQKGACPVDRLTCCYNPFTPPALSVSNDVRSVLSWSLCARADVSRKCEVKDVNIDLDIKLKNSKCAVLEMNDWAPRLAMSLLVEFRLCGRYQLWIWEFRTVERDQSYGISYSSRVLAAIACDTWIANQLSYQDALWRDERYECMPPLVCAGV